MRKLKTFMLYYFWLTKRILSMANTFSRLNIHCVFSTKERVWVLNPEIGERLFAERRTDDGGQTTEDRRRRTDEGPAPINVFISSVFCPPTSILILAA